MTDAVLSVRIEGAVVDTQLNLEANCKANVA